MRIRRRCGTIAKKEERPMRRKDREMDRAFALEVLDKAEWMTLAMTGEDGTPYCVPVNAVREGDWLYLHSAPEGEKAEDLRRRPRVCLSAVGDTCVIPEQYTTAFESAVVRGEAGELIDPEEKRRALHLICQKYCPGQEADFDRTIDRSIARTAVFRIHIDEIAGKCKKQLGQG